MKRKLSKAEQEYIERNHTTMSAEQLCADMDGIGVKTVQAFIDTNIMTKGSREDTHEERQEELQKKTGLTAGKLMGRDPFRGIAIMTEAASELSDARRNLNQLSQDAIAKKQADRIHIIDKSKKVR